MEDEASKLVTSAIAACQVGSHLNAGVIGDVKMGER
jgi:hypothetical protein